MARFRRKRSRSRASGFKSFFKRRGSSKKSGGGGTIEHAVVGGVYGAARPYVSKLAEPIISKIPAGVYADEIALGGAAVLIGMLMPGMKRYTNKVVTVESSRIGELLTGGTTTAASTGSMPLLG